MYSRLSRGGLAALVVVASLLVLAPSASAIDPIDTQRLRDAVTVNGILGHERALQRIANLNDGTRASGTPGYDASAEYVKRRLENAGYNVREQEFTFPFYAELAPAVLEQVSPTPKTYETGTYDYSGSGDVTAPVQPVNDLVIPPTPEPSSTAGCEDEDFAGFVAGNVALIQRGTCTFAEKVVNAQEAGASAVIMFNEGQPGRDELFIGTLGAEDTFTIPVVGASFADGVELYNATQAGEVVVHVVTSTEVDPNRTTRNVLGDSVEGASDRTVVVGAHLDSVVPGPGINDNGSGISTLLEIAEELTENNIRPRNKVRFAFWGAEEAGLLGSEHYVSNLSDEEIQDLFVNLNFDMLGSPNYVRFVYDGDGSDTETAGPPGSAQTEKVFTDYFASQNLPTSPTAFDGRSDYGPFIAVGVPAGGLFSGAEGEKTPEEAAIYGGTAGQPYDPCYHLACDDITNLSTKALFELGDGVAHATMTFIRTRSGLFEDGSRRARSGVSGLDYKGPRAVR